MIIFDEQKKRPISLVALLVYLSWESYTLNFQAYALRTTHW